jgi:hypothetical protein
MVIREVRAYTRSLVSVADTTLLPTRKIGETTIVTIDPDLKMYDPP